MSDTTRIRVSTRFGEVEFEGSEEFVNKQIDNVEGLLERFHNVYLKLGLYEAGDDKLKFVGSYEKQEVEEKEQVSQIDLSVPDTFGEWYQKFPKDMSENDVALVTGYFHQEKSDTKEFKTQDVNNLLNEFGIKLSNTSLSVKRLVENKFAFPIGKEGRIKRYKIAKPGEEKMKELIIMGNTS